MALSMGVASQTTWRVVAFHPIQDRRRASACFVEKQRRNGCGSVSVSAQCSPAPVISSPQMPIACSVVAKQSVQCNPAPVVDMISSSTRTVTTLLGMAVLCMRAFAKMIPVVPINNSSIGTMGSLFFASLRDRPGGYLNTPLTVVAAGLGKWLDIYSGVLMVRVLLSWFPNIPWERQPLCAIRDLCDPYLNLFRNIIPPVFDTLDVSPLLAFAVLGTLGSILQTAMT